jgi:hypothetical protein
MREMIATGALAYFLAVNISISIFNSHRDNLQMRINESKKFTSLLKIIYFLG